ncbi:MAG: hypothetical protein WCG75_04310 [Armatimonadota bacterium]
MCASEDPGTLFTGTPIEVVVTGPDKVVAGSQFAYTIKVRDIDQKTFANPRGIDPSTSIYFEVPSMSDFQFKIAPNPDPDGYLVCVIIGIAVMTPGIYMDGFRGYDSVRLVSWDPPRDVVHTIQVTAA